MRRLALTLASPALLALTACGGSDEPAADAGGDDGASIPACSDVWVDRETLPEDYEGCMENADSMAAAVLYDCADGSQLASYDDRFYARLGGPISEVEGEMAADPDYKKVFDAC